MENQIRKKIIESFKFPKVFLLKMIQQYQGITSLRKILRILNVSKSTYYYWLKVSQDQKRKLANRNLIVKRIKRLCQVNKFYYGFRKITMLYNRQYQANLNITTVYRIMKQNHCLCKLKPKRYRHQYQSNFTISENLIHQDQNTFYTNQPMQKLFTDITQFKIIDNQFLYLSTIIDAYNRKIIAFKISQNPNKILIYDTFNQIMQIKSNCIIHFDQGTIYRSYNFQNWLIKRGFKISMSRKAKPNDNALMESFFGLIKTLIYHEIPYLENLTYEKAKQLIYNFLIFYNNNWILTKLNYQTPNNYQE
ncbi:IS3 family transposase [Candidatus Phytoplasma mali]|uniref:IS3 family transposase n=1 Tax=Apple proliferation phytoplasma TaxID=37692 RepID=UPI0002D9F951|nr:IS3 family transposase [Candidatus Phytoplasma mali]